MKNRRLIALFVAFVVVGLWACSQRQVREDGFTPSPFKKSAAAVPAAEPAYKAPDELKTIFFEYDKAVLKPEAKKALLKNVAWLKKNPTAKIQVEGHCDERGTREYNYKLGQRRAENVKQYLVSQGVDDSRITTVSYGAIGDQNEKTWSRHRRAMSVIIFTDEGS